MKNVKRIIAFHKRALPLRSRSMSCNPHASRVRRLYKLILRVHRALPPELRVMGNNYARDEFKRHKNCKPDEARVFMNEWTDYAINLAKQMKPMNQAKQKTVGMPLDPSLLDHMTDDQIMQLYELHEAARADLNGQPVPTDSNDEQVDIRFEAQGNGKVAYKKQVDVMESSFNGEDLGKKTK